MVNINFARIIIYRVFATKDLPLAICGPGRLDLNWMNYWKRSWRTPGRRCCSSSFLNQACPAAADAAAAVAVAPQVPQVLPGVVAAAAAEDNEDDQQAVANYLVSGLLLQNPGEIFVSKLIFII